MVRFRDAYARVLCEGDMVVIQPHQRAYDCPCRTRKRAVSGELKPPFFNSDAEPEE